MQLLTQRMNAQVKMLPAWAVSSEQGTCVYAITLVLTWRDALPS